MKLSKEEITNTICASVSTLTQDWSLDIAVVPETQLVQELGFSSMEFIDLLATLETRFQRKFPYEQLMTTDEGGYRQELTVSELSMFVYDNFDVARAPHGAV
jgi:acyl carrier protein